MFRFASLLLLLVVLPEATAQTAPATYWVRFTDKANTPYTLDQPQAFLSPRALERRARQGIAVDALDLPVDPAYIQQLLSAGQFQLLGVSRWFNAVTIGSTDPLALDTLDQLPFVAEMRLVARPRTTDRPQRKWDLRTEGAPKGSYEAVYGAGFGQIAMVNGHLLHSLGGARGAGMLIGVLDSGFEDADSIAAFAPLRARGGIHLTRDLVCAHCDVYREHWHGRSVLSVMAADSPGELTGTAPDADYVLVRSEDVYTEYPVEEDNWIEGAELLDSLGCDLLNSSLGYTQFDDPSMDHSYADMDGQTLRISIAARIAAQKGMIPVISAGNSGSSEWYHIGAPADAIDVLAVGAVGPGRTCAPFSSRGPAADGRVKPDVSATGWECIGLGPDGSSVASINGTSFSSPLVCGATACLWQLHRDRSSFEVMDAVRRSASCARAPNDSLGYGIPDFWRAHLLLGGNDLTGLSAARFFRTYPVPFTDHLDLELYTGNAAQLTVELFDAMGRSVAVRVLSVTPGTYQQVRFEDPALVDIAPGVYVLRASLAGQAGLTTRVLRSAR